MPGGSYKKPGNWRTLTRRVLARDGYRCFCGAPASKTPDHIIPRSQGGSDDLSNLRAICQPCHDEKSKREAAEGRRRAAARRKALTARRAEPHPGLTSPDA